MPLKTLHIHKYACDIHVLLFLDNTYGAILFDYFNVKFSVPINILNKHGLEHITFRPNNSVQGLEDKIECGLLCAFNDECDFFLYQGRNCYLASYNTTGRGLYGDSIDSSETACYQNSSKIILLISFFSLTKIISLKFKPQQRMTSPRKSFLMYIMRSS